MAVALIDCDNFFASCERIMQPRLLSVPVAVLSNNDGCVIARTNEVKAAGVKMGQPYFECESILKAIGAEVVSANFLLYRGCAKRLQSVLKNVPNNGIEVYSIDESFLFFDDTQVGNVLKWATNLIQLVYDWTGIPVTVGVAQSRALAKVAVRASKTTKSHVADLRDISSPAAIKMLESTPVGDIWGVGRRMAPKLKIAGINNAWDFAKIESDSPVLNMLNAPSRQLIYDLRGWSSHQELPAEAQKTMVYTRAFGQAITELADIRSALGDFADSIAAKLRRQGLVAGHISVFLLSREHGFEKPSKAVRAERTIAPTADTFALEVAVQEMVSSLYEPKCPYKKAGVVLGRLSPAEQYQISLYTAAGDLEKSDSLMRAIDKVSEKTTTQVRPAVTYLGNHSWRGKRQKLSPYDHASWQSIPAVY